MKTHLTALTLFTMMTPFSEAADVTVNFAGYIFDCNSTPFCWI